MQSQLERLSAFEAEAAIATISQAQQDGTLVIMDPYCETVENREHGRFTTHTSYGVAGGGATGALLFTLLESVALGGVVGGLIAVTVFYFARQRWNQFEGAYRQGVWSDYLTDGELEELARGVHGMGKPATTEAAESLAQAQAFLEEQYGMPIQAIMGTLDGDRRVATVDTTVQVVKDSKLPGVYTLQKADTPVKAGKPKFVPSAFAGSQALPPIESPQTALQAPQKWQQHLTPVGAQPEVSVLSPAIKRRTEMDAPIEPIDIANVLFCAVGKVNPELLALPVAERAEILIQALRQSGCHVRQYLKRPLMGVTGMQRSGKTTLIMLLIILKKALEPNKRFYYVSGDDDLYPFAFDQVFAGGTSEGATGFFAFTEMITNAAKGSLSDQVWLLDETTKTLRAMDAGDPDKENSTNFYNGLSTGYIKTKCQSYLVFHGTTAATMGIPSGYAEQMKNEIAMLKAHRTETADGDYYPSGKYSILEAHGTSYVDSGDTQHSLPDWLLFAVNPTIDDEAYEGGHPPCYVHSFLEFFPEFDTRKTTSKSPQNTLELPELGSTRDRLNHLLTTHLMTQADNLHMGTEVDTAEPPEQAIKAVESSSVLPDAMLKVEVASGVTYERVINRFEVVLAKRPDGDYTISELLKESFRYDIRNLVRPHVIPILNTMIQKGLPIGFNNDQTKVGMMHSHSHLGSVSPHPLSSETGGLGGDGGESSGDRGHLS